MKITNLSYGRCSYYNIHIYIFIYIYIRGCLGVVYITAESLFGSYGGELRFEFAVLTGYEIGVHGSFDSGYIYLKFEIRH